MVFLFSHAFPPTEGSLVFVLFVGFVFLKASCLQCEESIQDKSWQEPTMTCNPDKDWRKLKESLYKASTVGYKGETGRREETEDFTLYWEPLPHRVLAGGGW